MKSTILGRITATALFFALAIGAQTTRQEEQEHKREQFRHYRVKDLGTLGGTYSFPAGINNKGWVSGGSTLPGDVEERAVLWREGRKIEIGTFGGPNSGSLYPLNEKGEVTGGANTSDLNPYGYQFCAPLGFTDSPPHICVPFVWQNGVMTKLPTLGGDNGFANEINNRSLTVGVAETTTLDPTCSTPTLEQKPVIWEKDKQGKYKIHELPIPRGDLVGSATAINDRDQVIGFSGTGNCTNPFADNALWEHGMRTKIDLSKLPNGTSGLPVDINSRAQVVGFSGTPPGLGGHAYLWQNGRIRDLGTLNEDAYSAAMGVNDSGQIVGQSCPANATPADLTPCRAFIWQNGLMADLNSLVPAGSPYLFQAVEINDRGQITGSLMTSTGEMHAFRATPCDQDDNGAECCDADDK